jgi:hypothetical protein
MTVFFQWPSLHCLCTDRIENAVSNISSIIVAGRCITMARLFIEPLQRNRKILNSHVTIFTLVHLGIIKQKGMKQLEVLRHANIS